jgi:TIR domain-containing protein
LLFLSYAEEDSEIASQVAAWLTRRGLQLYNWRAPQYSGGLFLEAIQEAMNAADDFVAILSPHYLTSYWCQREKNLALQREKDLREVERNRCFIHVLEVTKTPPKDAGFLRDYDWISLVGQSEIGPDMVRLEQQLRRPASRAADQGRIGSEQPSETGSSAEGGRTREPPPNGRDEAVGAPKFLNREHELEEVLRGLRTPGGQCFWLITAPPQLGKTWFLRQVVAEAAKYGWISSLIDLREEPPQLRTNAAALIALLFGMDLNGRIDPDTQHRIALEICRTGRPYLCLLDNAELLDEATAAELRSCLSEIHREVEQAMIGARLAFVVASRREGKWRGATRHPRISSLTLSEFTVGVVMQSLVDLARTTGIVPFRINLDRVADQAFAATEGLPAILAACLEWIRDEQWLRLERLDTQIQFNKLTEPYIKQTLLASDSFFPGPTEVARNMTPEGADAITAVLERAYRALVPYRLFTQSHLRHHLENDAEFNDMLSQADWSVEDLWLAISGTALLLRPLDEPWQKIHPAVRRLLYRSLYQSTQARSDAHQQALRFVEIWGEQQFGKEQIVGLVECLWHEAAALADLEPAQQERRLLESAASLSRELKPSPLYTVDELRGYAADRMRQDDELEAALSMPDGLFERLIETVITPPQLPER